MPDLIIPGLVVFAVVVAILYMRSLMRMNEREQAHKHALDRQKANDASTRAETELLVALNRQQELKLELARLERAGAEIPMGGVGYPSGPQPRDISFSAVVAGDERPYGGGYAPIHPMPPPMMMQQTSEPGRLPW